MIKIYISLTINCKIIDLMINIEDG